MVIEEGLTIVAMYFLGHRGIKREVGDYRNKPK